MEVWGRGADGGVELASEVAKFVYGVDSKAAECGALAVGREGVGRNRDGFGNVVGQRVNANPKFDDAGGRARRSGRMAHLVAQRLNGGANLGGIFRNKRELLAVDFEGVGLDVRGDLLEGFGRDAGDFGEAEVGVAELIVLLDEVIGVAAADAGAVGAELAEFERLNGPARWTGRQAGVRSGANPKTAKKEMRIKREIEVVFVKIVAGRLSYTISNRT